MGRTFNCSLLNNGLVDALNISAKNEEFWFGLKHREISGMFMDWWSLSLRIRSETILTENKGHGRLFILPISLQRIK